MPRLAHDRPLRRPSNRGTSGVPDLDGIALPFVEFIALPSGLPDSNSENNSLRRMINQSLDLREIGFVPHYSRTYPEDHPALAGVWACSDNHPSRRTGTARHRPS